MLDMDGAGDVETGPHHADIVGLDVTVAKKLPIVHGGDGYGMGVFSGLDAGNAVIDGEAIPMGAAAKKDEDGEEGKETGQRHLRGDSDAARIYQGLSARVMVAIRLSNSVKNCHLTPSLGYGYDPFSWLTPFSKIG